MSAPPANMSSPGANLPPFSATRRANLRPHLQTDLDNPSAAPTSTPIATTPDALDFYRQRGPSVLSSNAVHTSSASTGQRQPDRSAFRSASNPGLSPSNPNPSHPQQRRAPVHPKASFKDLVARFDQPIPATVPTNVNATPRSVSANSGSANPSPAVHMPSFIPQPAASRPRSARGDSDTVSGVSEPAGQNVAPPHSQHRRQRSNSFATSPQSQSRTDFKTNTSQGPLFGEILVREANSTQPGYGINTPGRRRGSDTSTMHRPNAMFPAGQNEPHLPGSRAGRQHQRSASNIHDPVSPPRPSLAPDYGSRASFEEQYGMPQAPSTRQRPSVQPQSQSRIPVKVSSRPSTPVSTQHTRSLSHTTPTQHHSSPSHRQAVGSAVLSNTGPRLKAKILAPEPKQSPPLRSSRPRQQVNEFSVSGTWSRSDDPFQKDPFAASGQHETLPDFLRGSSIAVAPPKTQAPGQRNFFERTVENPAGLPTLSNSTYEGTVPRLKLDTHEAQSTPGALEEPLTGATEFEDDSLDTNDARPEPMNLHQSSIDTGNSEAQRMPRSVLSQVFELRRRNTNKYSMPGSYESAQPDDDSGTIQIMLGGTPILDKYNQEWSADSPMSRSDELQKSESRHENNKLSPTGWSSSGAQETHRSLDVRPNSAAYSIIDNILNQYLERQTLTPQMLHEFTQQIQEIEPDLTEKEGYDPEEIARATLQGLIDEMRPLHKPLDQSQPTIRTVQNDTQGRDAYSGSSESRKQVHVEPDHYQAQADWAKRVGYQVPQSRPAIFTTGSHTNGRIEQTVSVPSTELQSSAPPSAGLSLPDIDTGEALGGMVESQISRGRSISPAGMSLHTEPHRRPDSTPPVHEAQDISTSAMLSLNGHPRQSTSINSASGRPSTSDQREGTSSASIKSQEDAMKEEKRLNTRRMIIKELVDTEFSYSADMKILEDIYMATGKSTDAINDDDQRILFGNMHEIVAFTMAFQDTLKRAAAPVYSRPREKRFAQIQLGADGRGSMSTSNSGAEAPSFQEPPDDHRDRQTTIGGAFWQHMTKFEKVYGDYMRNHSAANERYLKIKDQRGVQAWINECKEYAKDLTDAWDLDSLLVKPTQRMMKYHMILDSLLSKTHDDHPDRDQLKGAISELKAATSRINESKKRSDLLDQINNPRKRSDVSLGISKVLGRRQDKLRQQIGLTEAADDAEFLSVNEKYGGYYLKLQVVMRDFDSYKQKTDSFMIQFNALIDTWEQTMDVQDKPIYTEIESKWRRAAATIREMTQIAWVDHEAAVQRHCIDPLLTVIKLNEKTQKFMQKRRKRMPEYAKYKTLVGRGDKPDKKTQEAADQYTAYTDSLKEELPKLYQLTNTLIGKCLHNFVDIQKLWHVTWRRKLLTILDEQKVPDSMENILEVLRSDWQAPYADVQQLGICNGATLQQAANFLSFPPERDSRQLTSGPSSRRTTVGSQQAPSFSSPELVQGRMSEQSSQTTLVPPSQPGQRYHHFPANMEEARNATAKYTAITTSGAPSHVREAHEYQSSNPARSSQPANAGRPSMDSFAPHQPTRPSSSSTYYTTAQHSQPSYQGESPAKTNVFSSAMPMPDSPTQGSRPATPPEGQTREEVLFVAASLFEFHINQPRQEAGFRYLTYVPGEIFDVLGEKGELWLARNQDDPQKDVGWIWEKHFAKVVDM